MRKRTSKYMPENDLSKEGLNVNDRRTKQLPQASGSRRFAQDCCAPFHQSCNAAEFAGKVCAVGAKARHASRCLSEMDVKIGLPAAIAA